MIELILWAAIDKEVMDVALAGVSDPSDIVTVTVAGDTVPPSAPTLTCVGVVGGAHLELVVPTTNADGSSCVDFYMFRIYHSTTSGICSSGAPVGGIGADAPGALMPGAASIDYTGSSEYPVAYDDIIVTSSTKHHFPCSETTYFVATALDASLNESIASSEVYGGPTTEEEASANLIPNSYFEVDTNSDGLPDSWTGSPSGNWTRSTDAYAGLFSIRGTGTGATYTSDKQTLPTSTQDLLLSGVAKGSANPNNPIAGGSISATDVGRCISRSGNILAAISNEAANKWALWDMASGVAAPELLVEYNNTTIPRFLCIYGSYLYVASDVDGNSIKIYSISSPAAPSLVSTYDITTNDAGTWEVSGIDVKDNYLHVAYYAIGTAKCQCVDITNPGSPVYKSKLTISSGHNEKTGRVVARAGLCAVMGEYGLSALGNAARCNRVWLLANASGTLSLSGTQSASSGEYFSNDIVLNGNFAYLTKSNAPMSLWGTPVVTAPLTPTTGSTFVERTALGNGFGGFAQDNKGKLWVLVAEKVTATNALSVKACYSTDGGVTWTKETVRSLTTTDASLVYGALAVAPDNSVHVVFTDYASTTYYVYWTKRTSASGDWATNLETVNSGSEGRRTPLLTFDSSGYPHVAWTYGSYSTLTSRHSWRTSSSSNWATNNEEITSYGVGDDAWGIFFGYLGTTLYFLTSSYVVSSTETHVYYYKKTSSWDGGTEIEEWTGWSANFSYYHAPRAVSDGSNIYYAYLAPSTSYGTICTINSGGYSAATITTAAHYGPLAVDVEGNMWMYATTSAPAIHVYKKKVGGSWALDGDSDWGLSYSAPLYGPYPLSGPRCADAYSQYPNQPAYGAIAGVYSADGFDIRGERDADIRTTSASTTYELIVLDITTPASVHQEGSDLGAYQGSSGNTGYRTGYHLSILGSWLYILRCDDLNKKTYIACWDITDPSTPSFSAATQINTWTAGPSGPHNFIVSGYIGYYPDVAATKIWLDTMASLNWDLHACFYDAGNNLLATITVYEGDTDSPLTSSTWTAFTARIHTEDIPPSAAKVEFVCQADCGTAYVYIDSLSCTIEAA